MKTSAHRSELDAMVVGVELTLVSIIQGVALTYLIENARVVVAERQFILWPYVIGGLFVILIFWSRSVLHIITVIRWPLEFGHNFLYIACALVESIMFTQLSNPTAWFALGAAFATIGWVLFVYDLRLIRARTCDSAGEASHRLCTLVRRDQWLNIAALLPGVFLLNAVCVIAIRTSPDFFLHRHGHVWLAAVQVVFFSGYLFYVVQFFSKLAPLVASARAEWRAADERSGHVD